MNKVWLDVDPTDIAGILLRLFEMIRAKEFGWEFVGLLLAAAEWVKETFGPDPKPLIGDNPAAYSAALEIMSELGEKVPAEGPLTDAIIAMAIRAIIKKLIESGEVPQWLIDLFNKLVTENQ